MSSIIGRAVFRATPALRATSHREGAQALKAGAKRDPELFPLYVVVSGIFAWAGYRFVQSPTGSDYSGVATVDESKPWEKDASSGKYKYYVAGDPKQGVKDAPSALNTVIIPNVTLPKELHEKYNKFGKEDYDF
ncbi:hypothetical protein M011DRAFT_466493 [Sporormia fimetaria CBS 119925]|uniref:Uncharacterized protein n=1 Tax=Sporormia fimetaria CBS 119925 TaxID=1340428 RepID=A0A6A6VGJ4_9PLEO|nr:hypothetical protein M011DRAFT_466493 [Sporormia fimetaria CBS 119925]